MRFAVSSRRIVGVLWSRTFGETADLAREQGDDDSEVQFVAGLRAVVLARHLPTS